MAEQEPIFDISHLSHVQLLTPKLEESTKFFKEMMGLYETERDEKSVYMRGYDESYHHSLQLTEASEAGLGHVGLRATSQSGLDRAVDRITAMNIGGEWIEGAKGYGRAFQYSSPDGHRFRMFWDVERATIPPEHRSRLLNRPSKRPSTGMPVRRLDHVNIMCSDVAPVRDFLIESSGARLRETVVADAGPVIGAWLSHNALNHDVAMTMDLTGAKGRLHHVAFYYGIPQHLWDMADLLRENGIEIDAGPGRHGITQGAFLYCFEPGGNRIEFFGDEGFLILEPDWEPKVWPESDLGLGLSYYGSELPITGAAVGTPPMPMPDMEVVLRKLGVQA
jgi:catechol 2,3-dioxygenase